MLFSSSSSVQSLWIQLTSSNMRILVERKVFFAVFALFIAYYYTITTSQWIGLNGLTVGTKYGALRGIKSVSRGGREYFEFLGVPYAKPPTGQLRFEVSKLATNSGKGCDISWHTYLSLLKFNWLVSMHGGGNKRKMISFTLYNSLVLNWTGSFTHTIQS